MTDGVKLPEDHTGARARIHVTERAILVAVSRATEQGADSLRELESLAATAGLSILGTTVQTRTHPDPATVIGKGKVNEITEAANELEADVIVFDRELTPAQARNLEERTKRKVIDRTQLIMDIFAQHAATKEARLQVELAQLRYLLPRLRGWGEALTRLGGGIGTRGPGETKLALDRNKITRRIHTIEHRLKKAQAERMTRRKRRARGPLPVIAIVGYTNSGKSTLLNHLCSTDLPVEDKLFSTLATAVRRGEISPGRTALFIDTVGFIRDLPHHLIPAFSATLEAANEADFILHITDASSPNRDEEYRAVRATLAAQVFKATADVPPILNVWNKADLLPPHATSLPDGVTISALRGTGITELKKRICALIDQTRASVRLFIPYRALDLFHRLVGTGMDVDYRPDGIETRIALSPTTLVRLRHAGAHVVTPISGQEG